MRKILCGTGLVLAIALCLVSVSMAGDGGLKKGGVLNVATIGEPPTLDPTSATLDVVGMISHHYFESLYAFGNGFAVKPLLAAKMPDVSADGRVYTIPLRKGVKFHNGKEMTADDVVASLKRWLKTGVRGKQVAEKVDEVVLVDPYTVKIVLNTPFTPILPFLSYPTGMAIIIPTELTQGDLTQIIGTGPYKLAEHQPDRYIRLVRFDDYVPSGDPGDLYAGARVAYLDEIRFMPVPNANTRLEGALAGQYQYSEQLPIENYSRLVNQEKVVPVMTAPHGWACMYLNCREGMMTDLRLRRAVQAAVSQEDMMAVAFGEPEFYQVDGSIYPKGYFYHNDRGVELYNHQDADKAKALLKETGYSGEPVRILTSQQYEFHFKMAQVAAENLREAGFKVDLMVVDWATLTQQRNNSKLWDIFFTHASFAADPYLLNFFNDNYPGWWVDAKKAALTEKMNTEANLDKRAQVFADVQGLLYEDVPMIKIGNFNLLSAAAKGLKGYIPAFWPSFWNVSIE